MESGMMACESLMNVTRKLGLMESVIRECKLIQWGTRKRGRPRGSKNRVANDIGKLRLMESGTRKRGRPKGSKNRVFGERMEESPFEYHKKRTNDQMEDETDNCEGKRLKLEVSLFKQSSKSRGDQVKEAAQVLKVRLKDYGNSVLRIHCHVNAFGKLCKSFDERRKKWVREMGFGGLLCLMDSWLPMNLCYWLMTQMDSINRLLITPDGHEYKLSKEQVRWILGIPKGSKVVPREVTDTEMRSKVSEIEMKFGKEYEIKRKPSGRVYKRKDILVDGALLSKAKGSWEEEDEEEFKSLFLILALHMILCPPLSSKFDYDLVPALSCAKQAWNYDWCELVLEKLWDSGNKFANKFYADGFAKGCGGCGIFLAIFYLDRLHRDPVMWGKWPRIKAWTKEKIVKAVKEDRVLKGDFGNTGCIDVAYGEEHPWEAEDMDDLITSSAEEGLGPNIRSQRTQDEEETLEGSYVDYNRKVATSELNLELCKLNKVDEEGSYLDGVSNELSQSTEDPALSMDVKAGQPSQSGKNPKDDVAQEEVSQPQKDLTLSLIDHGWQRPCCAKSPFNADERPIEGGIQNEEDGNRDGRIIQLAKEVLEVPICAVVMNPNEGKITSSHNLDGSSKHIIKGAPSCLVSSFNVDVDLANGSLNNPVIINNDKASEKKHCDFDPFEVVGSEIECRISKLESIVSRMKATKSGLKARSRKEFVCH